MSSQVVSPLIYIRTPFTMVPDVLMSTSNVAFEVGLVCVHLVADDTGIPWYTSSSRHSYDIKKPINMKRNKN